LELLDELLLLVSEFEARGVPYALCGGLAVNIHGIVRTTIDIDFLIPGDSLEEAKVACVAAGFDFESGWIPIGDPTAPRVYRVLKIIDTEYLMLDLILVNEGLEGIWSRRIRTVISGKPISLVSKEGLIEMKSTSKRNKDRSDVESLRDLN
jgi:hypothetical protein